MKQAIAPGADDDKIVTAKMLAKLYHTTATNIYRWAKNKKIPSIRFEGMVRFDLPAVRTAIEGPDWET